MRRCGPQDREHPGRQFARHSEASDESVAIISNLSTFAWATNTLDIMEKTPNVSSSGPGPSRGQRSPGGGESDTAAGKLADKTFEHKKEQITADSKNALEKNATALLRNENVSVRDMEEPGKPVKRAGSRSSRSKGSS